MFIPANTDHAITVVTFRVSFANPISAKIISAAEQSHHKWKNELPARRPAKTIGVGVSDNESPRLSETKGIEFAFLRPDGSPAWRMALVGHEIEINCTRYTRWDKIWPTAMSLLQRVLTLFPDCGVNAQVVSISLQVQDDFFWNDNDLESYDLTTLFKQSSYLAPVCFASGPVWHSHTGWFDNSENTATLIRIDINGSRDTDVARSRNLNARVEVNNEQEIRFMGDLIEVNTLIGSIEQNLQKPMEDLHRRNKEILLELLTEPMAKTIGLS